MYEPSRNLFSFHIAGFQHHDGALVLGDLKAGNALELVPERSPWHHVRAAVFMRDARCGEMDFVSSAARTNVIATISYPAKLCDQIVAAESIF